MIFSLKEMEDHILSEEIKVYEYFKSRLASIKTQDFTIEICKNPAKVFKSGPYLLKFIFDLLQQWYFLQKQTFINHYDIICQ